MITLICPNTKCLHRNLMGATAGEDLAEKSPFTCENCEQRFGVIQLFGNVKTFPLTKEGEQPSFIEEIRKRLLEPTFTTDTGKDDCQCLICKIRRDEIVDDPDAQSSMQRVMGDLLIALRSGLAEKAKAAAEELVAEDDKVEFTDLYKTHGDLMLELFPEGVKLDSAECISRYTVLSAIAGSLAQYAQDFDRGGDAQALVNIKAYVSMLEDLDFEVQIDG